MGRPWMNLLVIKIVKEVDLICRSNFSFSASKLHGIDHLRQVAYLAGRFALITGASLKPTVIGGYLHDWARHDDYGGNEHAHKSAELAKRIIKKNWPNIDSEKIIKAIYFHADGLVSNDPLIGSIWDADRITLTRLGIMPDPKLLSTKIAKRFYNMFIKHNNIFAEIKKISSIIIEQIQNKGEAYLGVWCGELSKYFLKCILILIEKPLKKNLSKLKIVSLYEYQGLSKSHEQSTCYQIYRECYQFGSFSLKQVICPLHDTINKSDMKNTIHCILPFEFPLSPVLKEQKFFNQSDLQINKIDHIVRDYRSRFFERYSKTPKVIFSIPIETIKRINGKTVLIDTQLNHQYKNISYKVNTFENILASISEEVSIIDLPIYPINF